MLGPNMTQARKAVAAALAKRPEEKPFQCPMLRGLLAFHQGRRFKTDLVRSFIKSKRPPYYRPCLYVLLDRDASIQMSWLKCVRGLYGKYDKAAERRKRVLGVFRHEAAEGPMMSKARDKYRVGACAQCEKMCKLAIDHAGKPFAMIVDEFLAARGLALDTIPVTFGKQTGQFRSRLTAREWVEYHDANADLVGLCRSCNSAKGSGGYRHKAV